MMRSSSSFFPLALIIVGLLWFLYAVDIFPPTAVLLSLALVTGGIAVLLFDGINQQSIVSAPLLIYCGAAVYLHSKMVLAATPLIALGMVVLGFLLLLARSNLIPVKKYGASRREG